MATTRIVAFTFVTLLAAGAAHATFGGHRDIGRETLGATDGWGASGAGVTGGSLAVPEQVYTVTNRRELIAALNNGVVSSTSPSNPSNEPKIIYVAGTIDANVDDENNPLACEDYNRNGFTLAAFLAQFDPNGPWGRVNPSGPLEAARVASQQAQQARVRIRPGSNTTIVGLGSGATIRGAWIDIRGTAGVTGSRSNIIIRNITFEDVHDCFPQWAPNDGASGAWNSLYDAISLRDTNNVWIDHNTFRDRTTRDQLLPRHFGVLFQVHDGHLDITNASDLVTVSWNRFLEHDKMMLIGSSDNAPADVGRLRVTLHHNLFGNIGQRAPRVRFGQVHLYNNLYVIANPETYGYSWGIGVQSALYAEENLFWPDGAITPDRFIARFNGTNVFEASSYVKDQRRLRITDLVTAWNAVNDPDLGTDVGWAPSLFERVQDARVAAVLVEIFAGPIFR
jgi:pectate lyase